MNELIFLNQIYQLHQNNRTDQALRNIFKWFDTQLLEGHLKACNQLLSYIDVSILNEDILVGFLTATYRGRELIAARVSFTNRVRTKLIQDIGVEEAVKLMDEIG